MQSVMATFESNEIPDSLKNGVKLGDENNSLEESYSYSDVESLLSSSNTDEHSIESLKFENTRLKIALTQLQSENHKAAQHGLYLLEEKENIWKNFNSLQQENDQLKNELNITQQSLSDAIHSERQIRVRNEVAEDAIEREKQERESQLGDIVAQLKHDLRKSHDTTYTLQQEVDRLSTRERELLDTHRGSEMERVELKSTVRTLKEREKKLNQELSGLEDENVTLQQQVSHLRMRQIENDRLTGERDRLDEKCVELTKENEELSQMKETFKSYYEKAIEALNSEKEQKKSYLVELEKVKRVQSIQYVPYQDRNSDNISLEEDSIHSDIESLLNNQDNSSTGADGLLDVSLAAATSLQDELRQLDPSIGEKIDLHRFGNNNELDDSGSSVGTPSSMTPRGGHSRVNSNSSSSVPPPTQESPHNSPEKSINNKASTDDISNQLSTQLTPTGSPEDMDTLRRRNQQLQQEVNQLRTSIINSGLELDSKLTTDPDLANLNNGSNFEKALKQEFESLKAQLTLSKDKFKDCERRLGGLEDEHRAVVSCSYATLDEVASISAELTSLQSLISPEDNQESSEGEGGANGVLATPSKKNQKAKLEELISTLQSTQFRDRSKFDTEFPIELITLVQKQLRELKRSCQRSFSNTTNQTVKTSDQKTSEANVKLPEDSETSETQTDLQPQIDKLKLEINKKREQITSLRAVLKANKHTTEVAMATVKATYKQEKQILMDSVNKSKNELKKLKNDLATFAYIRSMLVSRVDTLTNQLDSKSKENREATEKIQTLEQILRMSISQKLALTERLEALESGVVSPEQSVASSKSSTGSQKTAVRGSGPGRGFNSTNNAGNSKAHIPQRYAKNPRASDASYVKKAFLQNK